MREGKQLVHRQAIATPRMGSIDAPSDIRFLAKSCFENNQAMPGKSDERVKFVLGYRQVGSKLWIPTRGGMKLLQK
ncbi:MAG TPA: hypothetical protein DCE56_11125 [Cyanobacteria bacterium UBA8553]|nr:hypothetical protein [Cyanobacteria bacterium UBA8553]